MTESELILIHGLLKTLMRKTQTDGLLGPVKKGLEIVDRELSLKLLEKQIPKTYDIEGNRI